MVSRNIRVMLKKSFLELIVDWTYQIFRNKM